MPHGSWQLCGDFLMVESQLFDKMAAMDRGLKRLREEQDKIITELGFQRNAIRRLDDLMSSISTEMTIIREKLRKKHERK